MCSRGIDRGGVFADAAVVLVLGACGGVVLLSLPLSYLLSYGEFALRLQPHYEL